jgi:hypothetical protein
MAIKIYPDRIDIGDYRLFEGNGGVQFTGVARATNFLANQNFQGSVAGYVFGGYLGGSASNTIDKFPFAADTNATNVGNLAKNIFGSAGQNSKTNGYSSGGCGVPFVETAQIDRFPFAADTNATNIANLSVSRRETSGQSSSVSGYTSGGRKIVPGPSAPQNVIDKFPFATVANATNVGNLTVSRRLAGTQSSSIFGYSSGGDIAPTSPNVTQSVIDKFSFATDTNATNVGNLATAVGSYGGQSSSISGYVCSTNTVQRFSFATDTNAVSITSTGIGGGAGHSSTAYGYSGGGTISKFSFANENVTSTVGNLTQSRTGNGVHA